MKDKTPPIILKFDKSSNLIFNLIIFVLIVGIVYLIYSLTVRISLVRSENEAEQRASKSGFGIQVEVLNACGASGVADIITDHLRKNKIDVVQMGNYRSFDVDYTIIINRSGDRNKANFTADLIGIERNKIVDQINKNYFLDLSVIIGKDFSQLKPYK